MSATRLHVARLAASDFRNHEALDLSLDARPVCLYGPNGAGKTNILEALTMLAPGRGLRRAAPPEMAEQAGNGSFAVSADLMTEAGSLRLGTGIFIEPYLSIGDDVAIASGSIILRSIPAQHTVKSKVGQTVVVPQKS